MTSLLEFFVVFQMLIESNREKDTTAQYRSVLSKVSFTSEMCEPVFKKYLCAIIFVIMQSILHLFTSLLHDPIEEFD